ncbi:hypothetical protein JOC54_004046 [Alkalihalobacillus xiaoxiensis]|uniref:Sporulation histidine kinase inhibitor Sda n=1 Tax=Shouchella xiaoxiensis TaxID=766895 RepID=A0ABS2SYZ3_9BACI|nr:sporulation histidine kinase inhibitor Sda [Shouchella xiaoxiensis]MBM7840753.1 hypothetical protein [Shouchella xiaoxiensis]
MINELNDELLVEACHLAIINQLNADFIDLLKGELERRGLMITN